MGTILLPPDFKEFLQLLNSHKVEYLLVGGYAVIYYGYPRTTGDMDIWVSRSQGNAEKIVAALVAFGFPQAPAELFLKENQIIRMGVPPLRLEILTSVSGVSFDECYAERTIAVLDDVEINLISLKHLKRNKKASGRHKDLNDLENLP
ncbi:MAG TPA: hypothetical protein VNO70_03030 [Blastocatellia bacterium]|nr:hypothetical protein [Blastocatellia bacterium]